VASLQAGTDFEIEAGGGGWLSPHTGVTYPSGWSGFLERDTTFAIAPTVADQELDTRATTGVAYWEGSSTVTGIRGDLPIAGRAYVEITRYDSPGG
jgi:predicted secreted hydrolase